MTAPDLSIVAPLFEEGAIVDELVARAVAAAERVSPRFELVLVDDASHDDTGARLRAHAGRDPRVRPVLLTENRGQLGATRAGLAACRAPVVVVLDGDLQDPPELIPALVEAAAPTGVAFAVKSSRDDPAWFVAGQRAFHVTQQALGAGHVPAGAGSYCAMPLAVARRVARIPARDANLAALLGALGARGAAVPYAKAARTNGASRVGPAGLAREAIGSLVVSRAAERGLVAAAAALAVTAVLGAGPLRLAAPMAWASAVALLAGAVAARGARLRLLGDAA